VAGTSIFHGICHSISQVALEMDKSSGLKGRPPFPQRRKRFVSVFPSQVGEMKREIERERQLSKRRGLLSRKLRELDLPLPLFPPKLPV